ncbi:MAG: hypothetical protein ACRENP_24700, partial [Longimicrobiales bacterium]
TRPVGGDGTRGVTGGSFNPLALALRMVMSTVLLGACTGHVGVPDHLRVRLPIMPARSWLLDRRLARATQP